MSLASSATTTAEQTTSDSANTYGQELEGGVDFPSNVSQLDPSELYTRPNSDEYLSEVERINGDSLSLDLKKGFDRIIYFSPPSKSRDEYFEALKKWEGYVEEVREDTFLAHLVPIEGLGSEQIAEIYKEEVAREDRALIEVGAVFYWSIGYLDRPSGRLRASIIRFRRLPSWSKRDLENAKDKASDLKYLFDDE